MKDIIEGNGVQIDEQQLSAANNSASGPVSPASSTTMLPTGEEALKQILFTEYLTKMDTFSRDKMDVSTPNLNLQKILPYAPYLCFEGNLTVKVRPLTRAEYLSVLKQTSPSLWQMLEETDLKELLPMNEIKVYRSFKFAGTLDELGLNQADGREELGDLYQSSSNLRLIPSLEFFSLFMKEGAALRHYLQTLNDVMTSEDPIFYVGVREHSSPNCIFKSSFPIVKALFSPDRVLKFVQTSGKKELSSLISEYATHLGGICQNPPPGSNHWHYYVNNNCKYLHDLLELNNPALLLK